MKKTPAILVDETKLAIQKTKVIFDDEVGIKQEFIAANYKIGRSLVSKWYKEWLLNVVNI